MEEINTDISKRITSLRFILILLVIFIHNCFTKDNIDSFNIASNSNFLLIENKFISWLKLFISEGIGRGAVPLFFIFAAYLQFSKNYKYLDLIKKKTKSLLIPFFLWSLITLIFYICFSLLFQNYISTTFNSPDILKLKIWKIKDWFDFFIGYGSSNNYPFVSQLWFVRDLFILFLLSPIFSFLINKIDKGMFVIILIWFVCGFRSIIISSQALFFYILGMYWAKDKIRFIDLVDSIKWYEVFPIFFILFIYTYTGNTSYVVTRNLLRICSAIMLLKASGILIQKTRLYEILKYLSRYSFFIYAIHQPIMLLIVRKVWLNYFPMINSFMSFFEYLGVTILLTSICLAIAISLDKICKPVFRLLNGGR